jgi:hypothetical protein
VITKKPSEKVYYDAFLEALEKDGLNYGSKLNEKVRLHMCAWLGMNVEKKLNELEYAGQIDEFSEPYLRVLSIEDADKVKSSLVIGNRVVGIKSSVKGTVITVWWTAFPEADNYYVFVYPKGADATVSANRVTTVNAGNSTSIGLINAISPETDYDIYVSARVGGKYQSLENALFTSAVIPVTPPSSYEVVGKTPTAVRLKWAAVKNADKYWVRLVDGNGNTLLTKESDKAYVNLTGLDPQTEYYVQLQARVPK